MSGVVARVRGAIEGPGARAWRKVRAPLPDRVAESIRVPAKRALRRVGLLGPRTRQRGQPGPSGLSVSNLWPGVAENVTGRIRGQTFSALVGEGNGRRLLDLGAGPCLFSARARDAGWLVTAVDARTERLPDDLTGITFIESDVRNFDPSGFDTIAILGLLYHLTLSEQEALLRACSYTRVILETQVHTPGFVPPAAEPWGREIVVERGLEGVVYPENMNGSSEANPMASVGNPTSFWVTEDSLLRLVARCGYRSVEVVQPAFSSKYGTRRFYVLN